MSTNKISIRNLQIITALDSISYGMIYCFIAPYILKLGGNHVAIGILAIGSLLGELVAPEVIKIFTHLNGRRYTMFFILNTAMITHLMMVLTPSYWFTILIRILFSITNQSQNVCLELLLNKAHSNEERKMLHRNYSILSGSGYIIGPVISGYLFDIGFGYVGMLASFFALMNSSLLMKVTKDNGDINPEHAEISVLEKAVRKVSETVQDFKKSNPAKHWDILLLKYLFASSLFIFFSKFSILLRHNYSASSVTIGYTVSYINALVFAATYYVAISKSKTEKYPIVFLSDISFFIFALFLFLICYAPYYELFISLLIPVIFIRTFILSLWNDLFAERNNDNLVKLSHPTNVVAGITIPLIFGIFCDRIGHQAVILFSCIPVLLCWIIVKLYSKSVEIDNGNIKDKSS